MRILITAPEPFFADRGTPIAVRNLASSLGKSGHKVDLLVYAAGREIDIPGVDLHRAGRLFRHNVSIGFSLKKLVIDLFYFIAIIRLVFSRKYDVIHCVEEALFMVLMLAPFHGVPVIYDMDSTMSRQLASKGVVFRWFMPIFELIERWGIKRSAAVIAVCPALREMVRKVAPEKKTFLLEDIPAIDVHDDVPASGEKSSGIDRRLILYVGNFEPYQGVDLLLRGFAIAASKKSDIELMLVGGTPGAVEEKKELAGALGIGARVKFTGHVESARLGSYLRDADILVSPRVDGINTPMKIYTYMATGKPILATNLRTHTQVLDGSAAHLVSPDPEAFAAGILKLADDPEFGERIARGALRLVGEKYTLEAFERKLSEAYRWIEERVVLRKLP